MAPSKMPSPLAKSSTPSRSNFLLAEWQRQRKQLMPYRPYESFVNLDFAHVSPVFPSDVRTLNMDGGVPQVNAKGLRRDLIAFKIIAVGPDIDGGGSVLPELLIEIVAPATIYPNGLKPPGESGDGSGKTKLVVVMANSWLIIAFYPTESRDFSRDGERFPLARPDFAW